MNSIEDFITTTDFNKTCKIFCGRLKILDYKQANSVSDRKYVTGIPLLVCELFLFYLRGVSFARVIVSRNGNIPIYKSALFLFSSEWKLSYFVRYR